MGATFGKENATVLKPSLGGGPLGLGDPDDRSLRKVEQNVIVSNMIRDRVRKEKCKKQGDAFEKCGIATGLLMPFKCRSERDDLLECTKTWFTNEELRAECTEEFLKQRSHFRRTGERGYMHRMHGTVYQDV